MDMFEASTARAVADLKRKQARSARWSMVAGIAIVALLLIRPLTYLFGGTPSCFTSRLTATRLINRAAQADGSAAHVTNLTYPDTLRSDNGINHCRAQVTFSDGGKRTATWRVEAKQIVLEAVG